MKLNLIFSHQQRLSLFPQGETFRCHWKTEDFCGGENDSGSFPSPPRPWNQSENIGPDDLTFVAEQVSVKKNVEVKLTDSVLKAQVEEVSFNDRFEFIQALGIIFRSELMLSSVLSHGPSLKAADSRPKVEYFY